MAVNKTINHLTKIAFIDVKIRINIFISVPLKTALTYDRKKKYPPPFLESAFLITLPLSSVHSINANCIKN